MALINVFLVAIHRKQITKKMETERRTYMKQSDLTFISIIIISVIAIKTRSEDEDIILFFQYNLKYPKGIYMRKVTFM